MFIMTRLGNLVIATFIIVFTVRELQDLGSCMSSPYVMPANTASTSSFFMHVSHPPLLPQPNSHFQAAAFDAYSLIAEQVNKAGYEQQQQQPPRTKFDVSKWNQTTKGGLVPQDREMLGRIYGNASSVFEFGLGESTYIANHVGVPRYSGIDSDPEWISMVRNIVNVRYRFYFADIGMTKSWGHPKEELQKAAYNYQAVPLLGEPQAFDVYMVDGRFRVGCLLMSFLHAAPSSRWDDANVSSPTVLVHDCSRQNYHVADHLLDLVEYSGKNLCAYKRKNSTTDEQLYALWRSEFNKVA